ENGHTIIPLIKAVIFFASAVGFLAMALYGPQRLARVLLGALGLFSVVALILMRTQYLTMTFKIGAEEMQSMNPLMVMALVPLLTLLVYPRIGRFASPLKRMAYGMFLAALSY